MPVTLIDVVLCNQTSISQMKEGYDTIVGERGLKISGGEKQRVVRCSRDTWNVCRIA